MQRIAKRVKANNELVDKEKVYSPEEAIELAKKTANTKFVGSIEAHIRTLIDAKKTDQAVRGVALLPNGTGKTKKVAAFVTEAKEKEAKEAAEEAAKEAERIAKEAEKIAKEVAEKLEDEKAEVAKVSEEKAEEEKDIEKQKKIE